MLWGAFTSFGKTLASKQDNKQNLTSLAAVITAAAQQ